MSTDTNAPAQVAGFFLRYMPLLALGFSVVATATAAQIQINTNKLGLESLTKSIELRVPQFLYDDQMSRLEKRVADIESDVESNEEVIESLERGTDQINSKIELEVERLRNAIERNDSEQQRQLESIILLLQQQRDNQ